MRHVLSEDSCEAPRAKPVVRSAWDDDEEPGPVRAPIVPDPEAERASLRRQAAMYEVWWEEQGARLFRAWRLARSYDDEEI